MRTHWRLAYGLPPTDPRYLDADEETIYHDLLVRLVNHEQRERALSPGETQAADLARNPDAVEGMLARRQEFMAEETTVARIQAALGRGKRSLPRQITLGRARVAREE